MKPIFIAARQAAAANWMRLMIALVGLIGVAAAAEFMVDQQQAYQDAARAAVRCQKMARQILAARGPATAPAPSGQKGTDDSAEIAAAASAAGITAENFDRIEHDGSQRVANSPLVHEQTNISLKGVSLVNVVDFLDTLQAARDPLLAQSLRISPADADGKQDQELWDAALTLVSVRYALATGSGAMARASAVGSAYP